MKVSVGRSLAITRGLRCSGLLLAALLFIPSACRKHEPSAPAPTPVPSPGAAATELAPASESEAPQHTEPAAAKAQLLQNGKLPIYELRVTAGNLQSLDQSEFSNETIPGSFMAEGDTYDGVRIRHRGAWARSWPKKPLKIFFEKGKRFHGAHCLNLNSEWHDPALIRECLAYYVFAACGAPASEAHMVQLNINGRFRGVYAQIEQPDQELAKRLRFKGAAIYKAGPHGSGEADERDLTSEAVYRREYEKQTRKEEGYQDLEQFCHDLARSHDLAAFFAQNVELDHYINYLCATVLVQNWDGFNKNHSLAHDVDGSHKWFPLPWDLDRTFGDSWDGRFDRAHLPIYLGTRRAPGITGWNRLEDRFLSDPSLRNRFLDRLEVLLSTEFTEEKLFPILDQMEQTLGPQAALDRQRWPGPSRDVHQGIQQVKRFIQDRRAYLASEIPRMRSNQ